jgi:hypothetical protein
MPLNEPNLSKYKPNPIGPVQLTTRSATRARLWPGGTYFRSKERGELSNLIQIGAFEDGAEGICVVQHTQLKPDEQLSAAGMATPNIELFKLTLAWNTEIRIEYDGTKWSASLYGIRWQIAAGPDPFTPVSLGQVKDGLFSASGVSMRVSDLASWPTGAVVYLRPRTRRYTLVSISVTDPDTMLSTTGWGIQELRGPLNGDATVWVSMPDRAPPATDPPTIPAPTGSDAQDTGSDAAFLTVFAMTNMAGGNGLPSAPVGLNTGPDRVMVHLNYSEKDDGSMGELNQVFEWVGDSAAIGTWGRYA